MQLGEKIMGATRILCVDDDSRINELNRIALTRAGYEVEIASSPSEALEWFRSMTFDLVITDLSFPNSEETNFVAKLRNMVPTIPIILISGNHNPPSEVLQQADAFVEKAYSVNALTDSVRDVLLRRKLRRIG
jgi:DNA-binding NtrC family response regulator